MCGWEVKEWRFEARLAGCKALSSRCISVYPPVPAQHNGSLCSKSSCSRQCQWVPAQGGRPECLDVTPWPWVSSLHGLCSRPTDCEGNWWSDEPLPGEGVASDLTVGDGSEVGAQRDKAGTEKDTLRKKGDRAGLFVKGQVPGVRELAPGHELRTGIKTLHL